MGFTIAKLRLAQMARPVPGSRRVFQFRRRTQLIEAQRRGPAPHPTHLTQTYAGLAEAMCGRDSYGGSVMANKPAITDYLHAYAIMREETDGVKDIQERYAATQQLAEDLVGWAHQQISPAKLKHDANESLETGK